MMKKVFTYLPLLFLLSASLSSCKVYYKSMYAETGKHYQEACLRPVDVIIVPGYPHTNNKWHFITKARVYWALHLYQSGITKNIIFSGAAVYSPYVESKIMAMYAEKLGIDTSHIFIETKAEHSTENLYYSYLIAKEQGFTNVALATDMVQSRFLKRFRRKFELDDLRLIPVVYDILAEMDKVDPVIDQEKALASDFVHIADRESFFKRFQGTMGKNVRKMMKENEDLLSPDKSSRVVPESFIVD